MRLTPPFGAISALPDFTVADADNDTLTVTLVTTNGALHNVVDADPGTPGIQLTGTAAAINPHWPRRCSFPQPLARPRVRLSVTDRIIATRSSQRTNSRSRWISSRRRRQWRQWRQWRAVRVVRATTTTASLPDRGRSAAAGDGRKTSQQGDGNGDGVATTRASIVLKTNTPFSNPGERTPNLRTLVADSNQGQSK